MYFLKTFYLRNASDILLHHKTYAGRDAQLFYSHGIWNNVIYVSRTSDKK